MGPKLNEHRPLWIDIEDVDPVDIRQIVPARANYVGVNSLHASTCFVHERQLAATIPEHNDGIFSAINSAITIQEITDGLTNTLLLGERAWEYRAGDNQYYAYAATSIINGFSKKPAGVFGQGDSDSCATVNQGQCINFPHANPKQAMNTFSSAHAGGANFAFADGSVRFISESADPVAMTRAANISDGEFVGEL